ncbi:MAG TPA: BON domain-containing protein [Terriglobia bacterium]|nr:BON domain-containing protein [Terriglobia bacterium]
MASSRWGFVGIVACILAFSAPLLFGQGAKDPSSPTDQTMTDDINAKLFADSALKTQDIRVSTQDAVVTLRGSVATHLEKTAVDRIASTEPGVQKVIDSLAITGDTATPPPAAAAAPAPPAGVAVPAGSVVTVRMIDSIDSSKSQPGQEFDATVETPVASGSTVAIPKDSPAKVRLVAANDSGRIEGSAQLELELISITVNGVPYQVQSGFYEQHGNSRGKRTAEAGGAGAVLGGLIGAIAGGGKGAAIGAGSGAAIGAGSQVVMHGSSIHIPSETKIDFTLKQPITINPASGRQ